MEENIITSVQNARVKHVVALQLRYAPDGHDDLAAVQLPFGAL